jgi:hypothetical protein
MLLYFSSGAKSCIFEMKAAGPGGNPVRQSWFGYSFIRNRIFTRTVTAIKPTTTFMRMESSIMEVHLLSGFE